jgi:phosphodiesterase/alkaline phosphatase D-like protein
MKLLLPVAGLSWLVTASAGSGPDCTPKQIHIAGGIDATSSMTVTFLTNYECSSSSISYGLSQSEMNLEASPSSPPYTYSQSTTKYGDYTSDYIRNIVLTGLAPATKYFYKVDGGETTYSFTTAPLSDSYPVKFAVVGDLGQTEDSGEIGQGAKEGSYI